MKRSLKTKMIFSYLAVALLTVLVVSALIRLTSGQSLMNLVVQRQTAALADSVESYYETYATLEGFFESYLKIYHREPDFREPNEQVSFPVIGDIRGVHGLVDVNQRALMPTMGIEVGQIVPEKMLEDAVAVRVDGVEIAYIIPDTKFQFTLNAEEQIFLRRTNLAIALAAVAGVLAAVGMGYLLAVRLIKPIRRLTTASGALAKGDLEQQVPVTSQDELGQLTSTFNKMSADLARADQERKRLTADITHDLSTPLQVISGYIEMLEEESVQLTPERIEIIKTEIEHLRRLVGDLGMLTQVEAGGLEILAQPVSPANLLQKVINTYQPIAAGSGITLAMSCPESIPEIFVDEGRILQVLKNLVENALRYTSKDGQIILSSDYEQGKVSLRVQDTGEGIDPADLPYVFERFFRADKTRGVNSGKMGLGLAISKALVTAQGGFIRADSAGRGQGTTMTITFPAYQNS